MPIDTFHVRVTDYFDYNPEGIGLGKVFYSQDGDGRDGILYKMVRYDSSDVDIMKGDPIYHDEDYYASLSEFPLAVMGYAAANVPCSKLASGEYYYAFIQVEGVAEVAVYNTTVAGGATTFDNKTLARTDVYDRPAGVTVASFAETVAVEADDGVVTPSTGDDTILAKLKVGDKVLIGTAYLGHVIAIGESTFTVFPKPAADIADGAAVSIYPDGPLGLGNTYRGSNEKVLEETATGTAGAPTLTMSATVAEKLKPGDIISGVNANGDVEYQCVVSVSTVTVTTAANLAYNWTAGTVVTARSMLIKALIK